VLFVGMLSGTYSSLCIATPVLADLKEREPQYKELAKRVALRESGGRAARRAATAAASAAATTVAAATAASVAEAGLDTSSEPAEPAEAPGAGAPEQDTGEVAVSAGQGAGPAAPAARTSDGTPRPATSRQQPRRGGSAQRRPGARKKRR